MPADRATPPTWPPDLLDLAGVAHCLSCSVKQAQRLLAAGKLPPADCNVSLLNSPKGRRWSRSRVLAHLGGRP